jgi:plastocyanin
MHAAIVHLTPILAAEKSKTPFYIAGGALVAWALIVSLGLGLRESGFPRTLAAERAVMAVTAVLVLIAVSMAVVTSGGSTKEAQAAGSAGTAGAQGASGGAQSPAGQSSGAASPSSAGGTSTRSRAAGGGSAKTIPAKTGSAATGATAQAQTKLAQAADPSGQLRFAKTSLTAKAGKVSIDFSNGSPLPHNLTIASGSTVLGATPTFNGGSKTLSLKLKPGTYKFYCSVPGHREAGMEGTLVVR